jgi:predicted transcriptional regulator
MKLQEIIRELNLKSFTNNETLDVEVNDAYVSDLLSDVMGKSKAGQLWITIQNHKNVIAVAALKDLSGVIFINGIEPGEDLIQLANSKELALLGTNMATYELVGKLYQTLNK